MTATPIIDYFSNYWPLGEKTKDILNHRVIKQKLNRKSLILREGQECNHFTFVVKGCLKMYMIDEKGNHHNLQFATENNWITDYGSFYNEEPSDLYIETIEPSGILQLKKSDVFYLYDHSPIFDRNIRIVIENTFIEQQKRLLQTISSTAEERYQYFLKRYPNLSNRISNVQIASYIGVTPEFLSMIRKRIADK
ncbi:Crp/Fnr family transcriptional regulator [Flagellimonas nanhaiensis]|uniref:Crp/Fnr family transcriptional regulator n=1 Tax=Flagellimonas nanhaiensis TaxID=2292706 RepID=A0A371JN37_9FLAO|nr:Crp/Fnr family transcriptional regulator [Allomuricauda nanhaiensis]RDY58652.1 Crp/Fnr family transcriptional regulator [Allomuricauda nanhaiensis]